MGLKAVTSQSSGSTTSIPSPTSNLSVTGNIVTGTAGEALSFGNVCYVETDGTFKKADDATLGKFPVLYMAAGTIGSSSTGTFLRFGYARNDSWTWTVGTANPLFLSTSGAMTQTAPSGTGNCIQVLAFPISATVVFFSPSPDYITHT